MICPKSRQSWDWKPGRSKSRVSTLDHYATLPFSVNVYGLDEAKWIGRLVLEQLLVFLYMENLSLPSSSSLSHQHYTSYKSQLRYQLLQEASLIFPVLDTFLLTCINLMPTSNIKLNLVKSSEIGWVHIMDFHFKIPETTRNQLMREAQRPWPHCRSALFLKMCRGTLVPVPV